MLRKIETAVPVIGGSGRALFFWRLVGVRLVVVVVVVGVVEGDLGFQVADVDSASAGLLVGGVCVAFGLRFGALHDLFHAFGRHFDFDGRLLNALCCELLCSLLSPAFVVEFWLSFIAFARHRA